MAAGKASTLLIKIVGNSTEAVKSMNKTIDVEKKLMIFTVNSNKVMQEATEQTEKATKLAGEQALKSAEMELAFAKVAERTAKQQLESARSNLALKKLEVKETGKATKADKEQILELQRLVYETDQHTKAMRRQTQMAAANYKALDALERQTKELAAEEKKAASSKGISGMMSKGKGGMAKFGAIAAGATAAAAALGAMVKQSAALQSSFQSLSVVWGDIESSPVTQEIWTWAQGMTEYGLSTSEAAMAASVLGAQLVNSGIPMEQAADATMLLVELSADLAAAFGTTVPQALTAMSGAFRSEYDALEKYGITINQAMVNTEAMAVAQENEAVTTERQAKVIATYNIILEQTSEVTGTATDDNVTLKESMSDLGAATKNLTAKLGLGLLPVFTPITEGLGEIIEKTGELIDENGLLATACERLTIMFENMWTIIEPILIPALEALNSIFDTLADFLNTYVMPVLDKVSQAFDTIAGAIEDVIGWIQDLIYWFDQLWTRPSENGTEGAAAMVSQLNKLTKSRAFKNSLTLNATGSRPTQSVINVNVTAGVGDPHAIAKEIRKVLYSDARRMGRPVNANANR